MSEEYECEECGDSFDSKRGLSIHKTQMHDNDDSQDQKATEETEEDKSVKTKENENIPKTVSFGLNHVLAAVFVFGVAVGLSSGLMLSGGDIAGMGTTADQPQPTDTGSQNDDSGSDTEQIDMSQINMENQPVLGDENAPVTMVIYEDFECPFCKRFETNAFPQIKENYVDTGKVKVVWKDLPLPERIHPWADEGAEAMECVYREGGNDAFWSVKEKVFENQETVNVDNVYEKVKTWAGEEGVSASALQSCYDSGAMDAVQADNNEASSLGISGTPTAVIDGQKLVGAQPYSQFKSAIDSKLE